MKNQPGFCDSCHVRAALAVGGALFAMFHVARAGAPANKVVAAIQVGSEPSPIVVSPDSSTVYVGNYGSDAISVISTATNSVSIAIPTDGLPLALAISPDGGTLYVSCINSADNGTIDVISTATDTKTSVMTLGSNGAGQLAVTPDGSQLWCPVNETMYIVDTATEQVIGTFGNFGPTGYGAGTLVFTPDGADAYVLEIGNPAPANF